MIVVVTRGRNLIDASVSYIARFPGDIVVGDNVGIGETDFGAVSALFAVAGRSREYPLTIAYDDGDPPTEDQG